MSFLDKLQDHWRLKSLWQVIIVLTVFTCTGFSIKFLKEPIMGFVPSTGVGQWFDSILYYVYILPVYFVILLFYGFVFGQFRFFWSFVKKTVSRLIGRKNNVNDVK